MSDEKNNRSIMGDLDFNDLLFETPANLTLRVHRTQRQQKSDRTSYAPAQTCLIRLNTGSDYIDPKNSYLSFSVAVDAGTGHFGIGSALNLINQVVVRSKSGVELDRYRRCNLHKSHTIKYEKSRDWITKTGGLMGYAADTETTTNPSVGGVTTTAVKYVIPLAELSGVFDPVGSGKLMPGALAAGMEVEITWETALRALIDPESGVGSYTITNPEVHLESIRLTDAAQRVLNQKAAKEGLSYLYHRIHTSEIAANATSLTHRVSLSVGQCVDACSIIVNNTAGITTDNNASIAFDATSWFYRIGQLYYPATTLTDDAAGRESYFQALKTFDKLHMTSNEGAVSQTEFSTGAFGALCMPFSKDESMLMSSEAVNNSRQLELQLTRSTSNSTDQQVMFVKYLAQVRIFLDSVVVAV